MKHFDLEELMCPHAYNQFGEITWTFLDPRLLETLDIIREHIDKSIYINNWMIKGEFSQRGFRCIKCQLVRDAITQGRLYISPHMTGQAVDFDITNTTAEAGRQWIIANQNILPYNIRLEKSVSWIHLDTRSGKDKITMFNG
jgi:hypothetical protein